MSIQYWTSWMSCWPSTSQWEPHQDAFRPQKPIFLFFDKQKEKAMLKRRPFLRSLLARQTASALMAARTRGHGSVENKENGSSEVWRCINLKWLHIFSESRDVIIPKDTLKFLVTIKTTTNTGCQFAAVVFSGICWYTSQC